MSWYGEINAGYDTMTEKILSILTRTLRDSPIIKKGEYNYFVHPIADGIPEIQPELLSEVTDHINSLIYEDELDRIVTIESMGIPIGTALSLQTGLPLTVIRKRQYGLPGEITVDQKTGYSEGKLYINGVNKGDRILLVDDVISTGGTMKAVIDALNTAGVMICDTIVIIEKGTGAIHLNRKGYDIKTLVLIDVDGNNINVTLK